MFALPGGFVGASEAPEQTAERKLREKTGVGSVHLEQLRTYADPVARPARLAALDRLHGAGPPETLPEERPADRDASWHPLDALPELALDHATIVDDGLWRLHARVADKVWFVRKALALLTEPFTLRQAQQLYEALRGEEVDAANFRRDVRATGPARGHRLAAFRRSRAAGPAVSPRLASPVHQESRQGRPELLCRRAHPRPRSHVAVSPSPRRRARRRHPDRRHHRCRPVSGSGITCGRASARRTRPASAGPSST